MKSLASEREEHRTRVPKEGGGVKGILCCCYSKQRDEDESKDSKDMHVLPERKDRIEPSAKDAERRNPTRKDSGSPSTSPKLPQVAPAEKTEEAQASMSSVPSHLVTQADDGGAESSRSRDVLPMPRVSGVSGTLLPPKEPHFRDRKTLVLDLDETLVHSSFTEVACDLVLTVTLAGEDHKIYVRKRPGLDRFMTVVSQLYEVAIFTASTALYANTLLDVLDTSSWIQHRLFREACTRYRQGYVKDLSRLGRELNHVIIIDNMPICYALQPHNAIPIVTWKDDPNDTELLDLLPILISLARVDDIPTMLKSILSDEVEDEPCD